MKWTIRGQVVESREAEDGTVHSFIIRTESGRSTLRNKRHIKWQAPKRVSFAELASDTDETAAMASDNDEAAAEIALETREPRRVSARLAALTAAVGDWTSEKQVLKKIQ